MSVPSIPTLPTKLKQPFTHLLNSCSSLPDLKRIHALILTHGFHPNLSLSTKLVSLACVLSPSMSYARQLFDRMPQQDVFAWNTIIRGYAYNGPCYQAVILYAQMHKDGFFPDNYTFPFVVRSCGVVSALKEGRQVHCNVIKNGFASDVSVLCSLMSMYAQGGDLGSMEIVFGEIGGEKNVVSWTAMIAGYVQNGFFREGLRVFIEMVASGARPNAITLVSVLPVCAGLEFLDLGRLIQGYGVKAGFDSDVSVINALIALYGRCGYVDVARELFDEMLARNLVSWNAMIAAYEQNRAGRDALKLFRRMQCEKVEWDYITMVSVISACASLGALNTGKLLHDLARRKGFENNASIANALIDMYAKCGNIELAKDVFQKLPQKSIVSWTSLVGACASNGYADDALKLFSKMKADGIRPNIFTFTAVLNACRHSGLVEEGRKHFQSMTKEYSIMPGTEQCACMVDLLGRAGCLTEAYKFIENMHIEADASVWGALLSACRIHGNVELAEVVADKLFKLDPQTVIYYVLMSNIYAEAGRWEDAARMKNLMRERELRKLPGQSSVEVKRKFYTFISRLKLRNSVR